jgi:hypothetical protein
MMKKATAIEAAAYQTYEDGTPVVYPLWGWLKIDGVRVPVEYLGQQLGWPSYEAIAPEGKVFWPNGTHTMLGDSQQDLRERMLGEELHDCDCGDCSR